MKWSPRWTDIHYTILTSKYTNLYKNLQKRKIHARLCELQRILGFLFARLVDSESTLILPLNFLRSVCFYNWFKKHKSMYFLRLQQNEIHCFLIAFRFRGNLENEQHSENTNLLFTIINYPAIGFPLPIYIGVQTILVLLYTLFFLSYCHSISE